MNTITIPATYHADLNLHDTQIAIKTVKDFFQQTLSQKLNLLRVSAPTFVAPESGLNDNLNGVERPVSFDIKAIEGRSGQYPLCLRRPVGLGKDHLQRRAFHGDSQGNRTHHLQCPS